MKRALFSERLLAWWDVNGRKDLPWQHPRTPYRVWVSEIMLQQTQVVTVIPYFEKFVQRFPDLKALADASLDDVLAHWAGLGYYARARNLHKAAGIVADQFAGEFPGNAEQLSSLPGIGASTANAIVSQAWDIPSTVVDGNVRRVTARHAGIDGSAGKSATEKIYWHTAEQKLPTGRGADYTQAIMDLGATLCTRSKPACVDCPVSEDCYAFQTGTVDLYPAKASKIIVSKRQVHMLILSDPDGKILLEKRPPTGIWGGLWSLPEAEDEQALADLFGFEAEQFSELPELEHRLTHIHMTIVPRAIQAQPRADRIESGSDHKWFDQSEWSQAGVPKPVVTLLKQHKGTHI